MRKIKVIELVAIQLNFKKSHIPQFMKATKITNVNHVVNHLLVCHI